MASTSGSTFWRSVVRVPSGRHSQKPYRDVVPTRTPRNEIELSVTVTSRNRSKATESQSPSSAGFGCTQGALDGFGGGRTRTVTLSGAL